MGKVQAPVALSSSNKVDMMGKSFCLLSSLEMKPLSSCNANSKSLRQSLTLSFFWFQLMTEKKSHVTIMWKFVIHYLQSSEVPRQLLDNWLEGTSVGLSITNKAKIEQESISAILFMFDAHGAPNQLFSHGSARRKKKTLYLFLNEKVSNVPVSGKTSHTSFKSIIYGMILMVWEWSLITYTVINLFCSSGLVII